MMTETCVHALCERPQRARRLCEMHYGRLKRAGLGELQRTPPRRADGVRLDAQLGQNSNCVNCGAKPWGGGMRCWTCFKVRVDERAVEVSRSVRTDVPVRSGFAHECRKHQPGVACYVKCRCRCSQCQDAKARYVRERRVA
jgi:hypothetical protein